MFCPKCKSEISPKNKFCTSCGEKIAIPQTEEIKPLNSPELQKLLTDLNSDNSEIRKNAVWKIAGLSNPEVAITGLKYALNSNDKQTKLLAINSLVLFGKEKAGHILLELLNEEDPTIKQEVIISLAHLQFENAVQPLINLLQHPNERIVYASIYSLGELKNPLAIEPLKKLLNTPNKLISDAAKKALEKFEYKEVHKKTKFLEEVTSQPEAEGKNHFALDKENAPLNQKLNLLTKELEQIKKKIIYLEKVIIPKEEINSKIEKLVSKINQLPLQSNDFNLIKDEITSLKKSFLLLKDTTHKI